MKKEYKPYIGKKFERSEYRILIIVDEVKDLADFRKSKYDNYCRFLIEKNDDVKKILEQYDLKKNDVACYNYRYNCKAEIKLEKLKGQELTEYNNELKNCINKLEPWKIIIQREQITGNVAKRKKYFDSGKITFEKFLESRGIKLFECRKDGKQDSSLIKDRFLELKSSLNKINFFLKTLDPCKETWKGESFFIYSDQNEGCYKSTLLPKNLNELYRLSQETDSSDHRYDDKWKELINKIRIDFNVPVPTNKTEWKSSYQPFLNKINRMLDYFRNYRYVMDKLQKVLSITNRLKPNFSSNIKFKTDKGKYLIVYTKDKKVVLDNIVDKYKEIYKLSETDFCFFNYIDKFDLLYELKEKNYQNLTERPLSWYNEKLVEFVVENKPSTIVFLGGQLSKTIFKNKIPSKNKKFKKFLEESHIHFYIEDLVTRESPSTKNDRLFQIKTLMESLQDDLSCLNPCNAAGELVLRNEKRYEIPESYLKEKTHDELRSKYHVSDSELERYHRYCKANDTLQKVIRKVNEVMPDDEELKKVHRMLLLLVNAFVPLPMFFELLDSFKDESDFNRIKKIITDRSSMVEYNVEFWKKYKDKEEYEKKKINSYNKRLNNFYTRLKEGHYVKDPLELMKERIFEENQIKKIKIYQDSTLTSFKGEAFSKVEKRNKKIESDRQILKSLKKDSECANVYREKIKKNRSIIKKFGEEIAIRDGYRLEEKVRKYLLSRLWKPKNP